MNSATLTTFRKTTNSSGLIAAEELEQVVATLSSVGRTATEPTPRQVADALVAGGRINRWQAAQLLAGRSRFTLGPYRVLDSIGQGGMGQVFKAEHHWMGRIVAVKVLPREKCTPEALERFTREIRTQAKLDHPHLVRALDAGHDGNVYYLVTEYVAGTDLRRLVRRDGPLSTSSAAHVASQAASGLAYAHGQGILHRDVKPGNLLVTPEGLTKLSDLGLVDTMVGGEASDVYRGKIVGTADYLCPEQVTLAHPLTPASDIYSLGCTLYYAVTGKVPFPGGTPREKAKAHCESMPLDPRRINPELSDAFVDLLAELMEKDPKRRPPSAERIVERLAPWAAAGWQPPSSPRQTSLSDSWVGEALPPLELEPTLYDVESADWAVPELDPAQQDSPSQISQSTHPVNSASEETLPMVEVQPRKAVRRRRLRPTVEQIARGARRVPWLTVFLVTVGVVGALVALGTMAAALLLRR